MRGVTPLGIGVTVLESLRPEGLSYRGMRYGVRWGLAAGDGDHAALRANGVGRSGDIVIAGFDGLRKGEQRSGVGGRDSTAISEGYSNISGRDVLREFGNGE